MSIGHLIVAGLLALGGPPQRPQELVEQLGAPRYADREQAARALEGLGREALPVLRAARGSKDPEIRARVSQLIDRIEADLMVRPTVVALDFRDRPLTEVVEALSERTGVPMILMPQNAAFWAARRVTLEAPQPVTFWEMLDRLGRAAQLQPMPQYGGFGTGRGGMIQLVPTAATAASPPASDSGPFRTTILGAHLRRDLVFGGAGNVAIALPPGQPAQVLDTVRPSATPASQVQFYLDLKVSAEPRIVVSPRGGVKLIEAIDELGQSLLPTTANETVERMAYFAGGLGVAETSLQVHLRVPPQPSRLLKRLRGTIPLTIASRREEPLTLALADAKGKTFQTGDLRVTIHDLRADADLAGASEIDLTIRAPLLPAEPPPGLDPRLAMMAVPRGHPFAQNQIEIVDAKGRLALWHPRRQDATQEETRMTIRLFPNEQVGPPVELRVYELVRANVEARFEFHDLPIP